MFAGVSDKHLRCSTSLFYTLISLICVHLSGYCRRVRETGRSTSTSDLRQLPASDAPPLTPTTLKQTPPTSKSAAVARKGSLREKLRSHLPAALTLDRRRKNTEHGSATKKKGKMDEKTIVNASREGASAEDKITEEAKELADTSASDISLQLDSTSSLDKTENFTENAVKNESDVEMTENGTENELNSSKSVDTNESRMQQVTPLKCKLIDASLKGSLDCLSSSPHGSQYRSSQDGSSHKSWMSTLRATPSLQNDSTSSHYRTKDRPSPLPRHHSSTGMSSSCFSSNPNSPKSPTADPYSFSSSSVTDTGGSSRSLSHTCSLTDQKEQRHHSAERLKRTGNYKPVILRSKEPMKAAFVMGLDQSDSDAHSSNLSTLTSTPNAPHFHSSTLPSPSSSIRPLVPPRTKFLSPSERMAQRRSDGSSSSCSSYREDSRVSGGGGSVTSPITECSSLMLSPILANKSPAPVLGSSSTEPARTKSAHLSRLELVSSPGDGDIEQPKTPLKVSATITI